MQKWRRTLLISGLILSTLLAIAALLVWRQDRFLQERLRSGIVIPPWEIYSQGIPASVGRTLDLPSLRSRFAQNKWRERSAEQVLSGEDFKIVPSGECENDTKLTLTNETEQCLILSDTSQNPLVVGLSSGNAVTEIWRGDPLKAVRSVGLMPKLVAQLVEGQPMLKKQTPLGDIPLVCLQAVTAIEDARFLEHSGVSATGILRAMYRNLRSGRWAEGGSTITQQLVKNFFLSPEKRLSRKIQEQLLAILLEARAGKDSVLEMYLNVIYMGQSGPYQVRGLGSAAEHYFDKKVSDLNLAQCALLAAVINSPGRFSPWDKPEAATQRRRLVLQKMLELKMITELALQEADAEPLPARPPAERREPAPFYIGTVVRELAEKQLLAENGLRVFTSLDPELQTAASRTLQTQVPAIEARVKNPHKGALQSALIAVDLYTSEVLAVVGGRDFKSTQFNRVLDARRQIGSVVKPFVYWPAMKFKGPLDMIDDSPFEWKMQGQSWSPRNYEGKPSGPVPIFWALAQSLNISTAKLGREIGLGPIVDTLAKAGLENEPIERPSLTLGALELSPWQVAQIYSTLANFGQYEKLHTVSRVEDMNGQPLWESPGEREPVLDGPTAATVVGMLRQTPLLGTAKSLRALAEKISLAGKTGTTSDTKDAWFVGFTPRLLTVVWVGFDDNTAMGLTGASAALPIWNSFFQEIAETLPAAAFAWPPHTVARSYEFFDISRHFPALQKVTDAPTQLELILPED